MVPVPVVKGDDPAVSALKQSRPSRRTQSDLRVLLRAVIFLLEREQDYPPSELAALKHYYEKAIGR